MQKYVRYFLLLNALYNIVNAHNIQKQTMYPSTTWDCYINGWRGSIPAIQEAFLRDVVAHAEENKHIPCKQPQTIRMLTFNVRMWQAIPKEPNFNQVAKLIESLDADIVMLQEVVDWQHTYSYFTSAGYSPLAPACITTSPPHGPAIFAKNSTVTFVSEVIFKAQMNTTRELSYVRLDATCNGIPITIYNTHLEVDMISISAANEHIRTLQIQEIITDSRQLDHNNIIIAGDFNTVRKCDYCYAINGKSAWDLVIDIYKSVNIELVPGTLTYLEDQKYISSFDKLGWQSPKYTNWASRTLDFIYLSPQWSLPLLGSYVYYTPLSDHLPIIADFDVS